MTAAAEPLARLARSLPDVRRAPYLRLSAFICGFLSVCALAGAADDEARFLADCRALTKGRHRLSGTAEYRAAADHVEKRLRAAGVDELIVQEFPSAQTRVLRCELELSVAGGPSAVRPLLPARPNGIIPPVSPPEGITGPLLYARRGNLSDFENLSVRDAIVVLDYNADIGWMRAFRLGAKAVVFVRPDEGKGTCESWRPHHVAANANLPRYFYPGSPGDLKYGPSDGASATIRSEVVWEEATGRNILALLRGTEPIFAQEKEELVVLAANLDTFGEVPRMSPGARGGATCAALLRIADHLAANRPRRHVLLAFLDNQARGHAGSSALYRALERDEKAAQVEKRVAKLKDEEKRVKSLRARLGRSTPFARISTEGRPKYLFVLLAIGALGAFTFRAILRRPSPEGTEAAGRVSAPDGESGGYGRRAGGAAPSRPHMSLILVAAMTASALVCIISTYSVLTWKPDASLFRPEDISDCKAFLAKVRSEAEAPEPSPGKRLWELLPADFRTRASGPALPAEGQAPSKVRPALTGVAGGQAPSKVRPALTGVAGGQAPSKVRPALTGVEGELESEAVRSLNRILADEALYVEQAWQGRELGDEAKKLLAQLAEGKLGRAKILRVNRLLLEAAYPDAIMMSAERSEEIDARLEMLRRLSKRARQHAFSINRTLRKLNRERRDIRERHGGEAEVEAAKGSEDARRYAELGDIINDRWQPEKDGWNATRRAIGREEFQGLAEDVQGKLSSVRSEVTSDVDLRMKEIRKLLGFLKADGKLKEAVGDCWIALHASLLLGDTSPRWGLIVGGDSLFHSNKDNPGLYMQVQKVFRNAHVSLEKTPRAVRNFELASADGTLDQTRLLMGVPFLTHSGEVAGQSGIYNLVIGTVQENLPREGTPDDTMQALDVGRVSGQAAEIARMLAVVASEKGLSLTRSIIRDKIYKLTPMAMGRLPGSSMPDKPMVGVMVQLLPLRPAVKPKVPFQRAKPYAFDNFQTLRTDQNGGYSYGPVPGTEHQGMAAEFDERGIAISVSDGGSDIRNRLNMFRCRRGLAVLPPQLDPEAVNVFEARGTARLNASKSYTATADGVAYWYCEERVNGAKLFALKSVVGLWNGGESLSLGPQSSKPLRSRIAEQSETGGPSSPAVLKEEEGLYGVGLDMDDSAVIMMPDPAIRSGTDLWRLNEARLEILRSKGIMNSSIEELHGQAEDLLIEAASSRSTARRHALAVSGFMMEKPVYRDVKSRLNDLVHAVLWLLALSIPFAFALERLLVGSTTIYKQVTWFATFFAATFLVLYLSHPAFAIAKTPVIIFLGFAVVTLAAIVIIIIMRKFELELKVLQGMPATVHVVDVSRFSTIIAAMNMGISTMRRRPLRTALTAITIILLTFTILGFASFGTQTGIVKLFDEPSPGYAGASVHRVNWDVLPEELLDVIRGRWGSGATVDIKQPLPQRAPRTQRTAEPLERPGSEANQPPFSAFSAPSAVRAFPISICPRYWRSPRKLQDKGPLITREDGTRPVALRGVLGLDEAEIALRPDLSELFGKPGALARPTDSPARTGAGKEGSTEKILEGACFITKALANALRVRPSDRVLVGGLTLRVAGTLDAASALSRKDIGAASILPVDFTEMQDMGPQGAEESLELQTAENWASLSPDSVIIVSVESARALGGALHAVMLYVEDTRSATQVAEDLARMLPLPVAATRQDGVYRHVLGPVVEASGARDLLFPILLGGLVIFGTMLGSVADRDREIYTFSALGLAPPHVASLFFAEALVYSVLGGLGGYLIAQGSMKVLSVLAELGLVTVPEMNYSSMNAIVTILIVMGTVLLSAWYPAMKASRSANPGILRQWSLPVPDRDTFDITFPFTVSDYDITGVVSFLKEHFDNYSDTGLGVFMARDARLVFHEGGGLGLAAHVALAPFDLGVTQSFELRSESSEIAGIDEVKITLVRKSGQPKDWRRLNKVLLDDIRRQFLIWRSLPHETMETYRHRTLAGKGAQ